METITLKNGLSCTIQRAQVTDALDIIDLMNRVDTQSAFMSREPGEFNYTPAQEEALLQTQQGSLDMAWFVARLDGVLVGMLSARREGTRKRVRHRGSIGLCVLQQQWGLGIGAALIHAAIAWAKEAGIEQIELGVIRGNERGLHLYQKLGFQKTGEVPRAFKYTDGTYADELLMALAVQ